MTGVDILGVAAMATSIVYTGMGLPMQIWKNYRTKSTKGLSLFFASIMFVSLLAWAFYGFAKDDFYILFPNAMGAVFSVVLLWQFCVYSSSGGKSSADEAR